MEDAAAATLRALRLEWTGIAGRGVSPVDDDALSVLDPLACQDVTCGTAILVQCGVVGKFVLAIERSAVVHVGERNEGTDAGVLEGHDVLDSAIDRGLTDRRRAEPEAIPGRDGLGTTKCPLREPHSPPNGVTGACGRLQVTIPSTGSRADAEERTVDWADELPRHRLFSTA